MGTYMSPSHASGKTAPRLVCDIHLYDPSHRPVTDRNLLSEVPPVVESGYHGPPDYISSKACHHKYMTKVNQNTLSTTPSKLFAICAKCRHHLQVTVSNSDTVGQPGQGITNHIHHLVYQSGQFGKDACEVTAKGQSVEVFHYECSYFTCSTRVSVSVASPLLSEYWVWILMDKGLQQARTEDAIAEYPDLLGVGQPPAIEVLTNLRTYISNALRNRQRSRPIPAVNKRFMTCFGAKGQPCRRILEFLEFTYKDEGFWEPPRFSTPMELPYQDPRSVFFDDITYELSVLIERRPFSEKKGYRLEPYGYAAYEDILNMLGSLHYPKASRLDGFQMPQTPCYEDLGTVEDMTSESIVEAYNRQLSVDPARTRQYLKSLKIIGELRGGQDGEVIDRVVQEAYAEGKFTDDDVITAYQYFGYQLDQQSLTDESIIATFHAVLRNTAHETEARRQLWRIGDWRNSEEIKSAAEDRVSTVEQAMVFLGIEDTTADDFVIAMYTTKITDTPSSKPLAHRAVELIAQKRKSALLKQFVETGNTTSDEMDVGEAYRLLQIPDRTVDEQAIIAAYTICVDEAPEQAETYHRALQIISNETGSHLIGDMVSGPSQPDRDLSDWPVGLQNIGNTCYLNSLLQFYFSLRPFREMVLEFEKFKMELSGETLSKKQVGSRKILRKEVQRSQLFLRELQILFSDMITSSYSFVTPRQELARLTLIGPSNEAAIRRRSTMSKSQGLGDLNGMPIMGPLGPPHITTESGPGAQGVTPAAEPEKGSQPAIVEEVDDETPTSDAVDKTDDPTPQVDDKENAPRADITMKDWEDDQPSGTNPNEPPPVPPRPVSTEDRQRQLREELEIGAQQDVTEAINNVLFQSQCAIKPIAISPDGEQLDQVKDLFYGQSKSYISTEAGIRSKEEWWCDIKVDVATGSRDIYAAIDAAFDVQKIAVDNSVAEQFSAISKLPPVLQIQVQRVQFDPMKKSSFKSTHHLDLKETIYLDRYMDTSLDDIVNRRRENWKLKDSLKNLEARRMELLKGENIPNFFDDAHGVLKDLESMTQTPETSPDGVDVDSQFLDEVSQLSNMTKSELAAVEKDIEATQSKITHQFDDFDFLPYRLYAIFIHHGTVNFGHYWIYIFDFEKNIWRKYNDTYVTEVQNLDEIFKCQEDRNPPTPYFLVYVNDKLKDRLASPVYRDLKDPAPPSGGAQTAFWNEWDKAGQEEGRTGKGLPSYGGAYGDSDAPGMRGEMVGATNMLPATNPLKRKSVEDAMNVSQSPQNPT